MFIEDPSSSAMILRKDSASESAGMPSFRDRLRMTWELTWPLAALDLAVVTVIHGVLDAQGETLDSVWAVAGFFVVSPWVIRRALARAYANRQAVAISRDGEERARLSYQQSLKVMWLLAWRSTVMALAALLLVSSGIPERIAVRSMSEPGMRCSINCAALRRP